jgi:hypothetical protein
MPVVADYRVIRDGHFDLDENEEFSLPAFFMPEDFSDGAFESNPVLMWKARPLSGSQPAHEATIRVRLDPIGGTMDTTTIRGNTVHGLWEVMDRSKFSKSVNNIFVFRSESGRVRISDVVLWYQRGI